MMYDIYDNEYLYLYQAKLELVIRLMNFFGVVEIHGLTVSLLKKLSEQARDDWSNLKSMLIKEEQRKKEESQ